MLVLVPRLHLEYGFNLISEEKLCTRQGLFVTFLSEPNSITSDGWNRAGKFGVALYRLPSLLHMYKTSILQNNSMIIYEIQEDVS